MKTKPQGRSGNLVFDLDLSPLSPLTPALSPLRGEGVALDVRRHLDARGRVPVSCSDEQSSRLKREIHTASLIARAEALNAATRFPSAGAIRRAPSPLNGERAGVRGEVGQSAGENKSLG